MEKHHIAKNCFSLKKDNAYYILDNSSFETICIFPARGDDYYDNDLRDTYVFSATENLSNTIDSLREILLDFIKEENLKEIDLERKEAKSSIRV